MAKRVKAIVKLQLPAGKATPAYPVGPALGQHGVAIMSFVKEYNERTAAQAGSVVPALVTIYEDRSFDVALKSPPRPTCCGRRRGSRRDRPRPAGRGPAR